MKNIKFKRLSKKDTKAICELTQLLNPDKTKKILAKRQEQMFKLNSYYCFGFYFNDELVGVSSVWEMVKLYSGRQIEIDNLIIHPEFQSKGIGTKFIKHIEAWAKKRKCKTIELNPNYALGISSGIFKG